MLVQQPDLPLFPAIGDCYFHYPSPSSTPSHTRQTSVTNPGNLLTSLPLSVALIAATRSSPFQPPTRSVTADTGVTVAYPPCGLFPGNDGIAPEVATLRSYQSIGKHPTTSASFFRPSSLELSREMPRQPQLKANQQTLGHQNGTFPSASSPVAYIAGGKRNAQALVADDPSGPDRQLMASTATDVPLQQTDQVPLRLPPKLKEAERMMHVQRWVNHLSWSTSAESNSTTCPTHWGYGNTPGYCHTDDEREHTPPPGRTYMSRQAFSADEEQTMLRFFTNASASNNAANEFHRNPNPSAPMHNNACPSHNVPYRQVQLTNALQQGSNLHATDTAAHPHGQLPNRNGDGPHHPHQHLQSAAYQLTKRTNGLNHNRMDPPETPSGAPGGGSRFFADWETRLISHIFHEYFPGRPEPMGNAGILPSVAEVRSRIATSRLKDTRTAVAVRAKIKRMQSTGTWFDCQ